MSIFIRILSLGLFLAVPFPAFASLFGTCTASALPIIFASYSPISAAAATGSGTVTVTCTGISVLGLIKVDVAYTINLSKGGSSTYSPRKMSFLTNTFSYNLYKDAAYTQIWGYGSGGTGTVSDSYSGSGVLFAVVSRDYPIYGLIPASQNIAAGLYVDTITVTVNY
jgi:spore coat protein U-like protein